MCKIKNLYFKLCTKLHNEYLRLCKESGCNPYSELKLNEIPRGACICIEWNGMHRGSTIGFMEHNITFPCFVLNLETLSNIDKIEYKTIPTMQDFERFYEQQQLLLREGEKKLFMPISLHTLKERK